MGLRDQASKIKIHLIPDPNPQRIFMIATRSGQSFTGSFHDRHVRLAHLDSFYILGKAKSLASGCLNRP